MCMLCNGRVTWVKRDFGMLENIAGMAKLWNAVRQ